MAIGWKFCDFPRCQTKVTFARDILKKKHTRSDAFTSRASPPVWPSLPLGETDPSGLYTGWYNTIGCQTCGRVPWNIAQPDGGAGSMGPSQGQLELGSVNIINGIQVPASTLNAWLSWSGGSIGSVLTSGNGGSGHWEYGYDVAFADTEPDTEVSAQMCTDDCAPGSSSYFASTSVAYLVPTATWVADGDSEPTSEPTLMAANNGNPQTPQPPQPPKKPTLQTQPPKPTFKQQACNALWSYAKQDMVVAGVDRG
jgi:hypothetical protein